MSGVTIPSKAGIIESTTGERHIPSSTRADGTKRKEIKIRPGYKPLEDVEVYKNRSAESWKSRKSSVVPGAEGLKDVKSSGPKAKVKSEIKREAQKQPQSEIALSKQDTNRGIVDKASQPVGSEAEKDKRIRNLKKKLKQATDLKDKKDSGKNLLPEQLTKIIRINELIRELDGLGINTDEKSTTKAIDSKAESSSNLQNLEV